MYDCCILMLIIYSGTIAIVAGDIESGPFIEALGQFSYRAGKEFICAILLVPDVFEN